MIHLDRIHTSDRVVSFFLFFGKSEECSVYADLSFSYTVEILPYALRAKGFILFNFFISLSLIFNQYVTCIPSFLVFYLPLIFHSPLI